MRPRDLIQLRLHRLEQDGEVCDGATHDAQLRAKVCTEGASSLSAGFGTFAYLFEGDTSSSFGHDKTTRKTNCQHRQPNDPFPKARRYSVGDNAERTVCDHSPHEYSGNRLPRRENKSGPY